jgi:hypothetical protein
MAFLTPGLSPWAGIEPRRWRSQYQKITLVVHPEKESYLYPIFLFLKPEIFFRAEGADYTSPARSAGSAGNPQKEKGLKARSIITATHLPPVTFLWYSRLIIT